LHDLGHYPYSHWVEELKLDRELFPHHEQQASTILRDGRIGELLRDRWGVTPEEVANIIDEVHTPDNHSLYNAVLNCSVDIDKVDYLIRDSIHCGVDYGKGIDVDRLLESLYVHPDGRRLCITDKGKSALISIIAARNIMYQEVYWHKTVRAAQSMFKRFFYEFVQAGLSDTAGLRAAMSSSDEAFLFFLDDRVSPHSPLRPLIETFVLRGRHLYKPALVCLPRNEDKINVRKFFESMFQNTNYANVVTKSVVTP